MKRSVLLALACVVAFMTAPLAAKADWYMDHNGSRMQFIEEEGGLYILYAIPREGIRAVGVSPGTLFFDGTITERLDGVFIHGTARVFKAGCSPATYYVEGWWNVGAGFIRLTGPAPVFANNSCAVVRYEYNHNSTLMFYL